MQNKKKSILTILSIVFGLLGLIFLLEGMGMICRTFLVRVWPTTSGQIVLSGFRWEEGYKLTGPGVRAPGVRGSHRLYIPYTYVVDGQRYYSDQIGPPSFFVSLGQDTISEQNAERMVQQYPKGKEVVVYYNPLHPQQAVISVQITGSYIALAGAGLSFLFLAYLAVEKLKEINSP